MTTPTRTTPRPDSEANSDLTREWLVTNGLGGYAPGTIAGPATRRYHGILIAALPAPHGRTMMLNQWSGTVIGPEGVAVPLAVERPDRGLGPDGSGRLAEFRLEAGLPAWRYEVAGHVLE